MSMLVPLTAYQIRLRPREKALLEKMAEAERRDLRDQAAVLIGLAVEAWAEEQGLLDDTDEPIEFDVEEGVAP